MRDARVADFDHAGRDGGDEVGDDVRWQPRRGDRAQGLEMLGGQQDGPAGVTLPGGSQHRPCVQPVGLDERRDRLGTHPGHPGGPEQDRARIADLGHRQVRAARHLPGRSGLRWSRGAKDRLGAKQGLRHGAVRIAGHDDDRECAAGPGQVGEPPDPRLSERVGDGALGRRREDDRGDGHAWPMCRYVTRSVPEPTEAAV